MIAAVVVLVAIVLLAVPLLVGAAIAFGSREAPPLPK